MRAAIRDNHYKHRRRAFTFGCRARKSRLHSPMLVIGSSLSRYTTSRVERLSRSAFSRVSMMMALSSDALSYRGVGRRLGAELGAMAYRRVGRLSGSLPGEVSNIHICFKAPAMAT